MAGRFGNTIKVQVGRRTRKKSAVKSCLSLDYLRGNKTYAKKIRKRKSDIGER